VQAEAFSWFPFLPIGNPSRLTFTMLKPREIEIPDELRAPPIGHRTLTALLTLSNPLEGFATVKQKRFRSSSSYGDPRISPLTP
jgi:hypothetical protein